MTFFTRMRFIGLTFATVAVLVSIFGVAIKGINYGIEFTGGVVTEFTASSPLEHTELTSYFASEIQDEFRLNSTQDGLTWTLRQSDKTNIETQRSIIESLAIEQNWPITLQESVFIGSQIGQELIDQGGLALIVSAICMMIYVTMRFEWRLASSAILALLHDVLLVLGCFAWFQVRFDLAVLAGLLAIMGYSLNDSIIVGDRIRELMRSQSFTDLNQLINQAVKSTFRRTLITSGTTLFTINAIGLMAHEVLGEFALSLGIGVLVGTLSSITIAATLPIVLKLPLNAYESDLKNTISDAAELP
jgi:preprotein translocase subunit SecF